MLPNLRQRLQMVHRQATEAHPATETSDRCDAVTMQNVNAHNHNQWVRRISAARVQLVAVVGEILAGGDHES